MPRDFHDINDPVGFSTLTEEEPPGAAVDAGESTSEQAAV